MPELSHFDESGASRMIDVGQKEITQREARAEAFVAMLPDTLRLIQSGRTAKGDVFEVARLAGIMAAKKTSELIPLCHPLILDGINVNFSTPDDHTVRIEASVRLQGRTGAEMEALTAVSIAALTIYDMCKSADRAMSIGPVQLVEKSGGKSGRFVRGESPAE